MATGDIVLNMIGRNNTSPAAAGVQGSLTALNSTIDAHIGKLVGETRAQGAFNRMIDDTIVEMRALESAQRGSVRGTRAAAAGTNELTGAVTKTQFALQQGVYAVDDFFAGFSTGGFQGGIRGATNNLTLMAGTLGTVRTQLLAVAGLAAVQIFPKIAERVGFANGNVTDFRDRLSGIGSQVGNLRSQFEINDQARTIPQRVGEIKSLEQGESRILELQNQITRQRNVEIKALEVHRNTLQDILDMQQRGLDASNLADEYGFLVNGATDVASIQSEIEKISGRIRVETERMNVLEMERVETLKAMPGLMRQEGDARRAERARVARAEQQARETEINTEAQRRFDALMSAPHGLSARGPQTLQSGTSETLRFLNQARLGAASKSSETKELEKLNQNSAEMLAALRESVRLEKEAEEVEYIDF